MLRARFVLGLLSLSTFVPAVNAVGEDEAPLGPPIEAIWQVQHLPFEFNGQRTLYACDSLERKISNILRAVGAHRSVKVKTRCSGGNPLAYQGPLSGDLVSQISATITIASPVIATDDNIRAMTTYDTEDELLARIKNTKLPNPEELERFAAEWRDVSLTRARRVKLDMADCELLQQLSQQIFSKIGVTMVGDMLTCHTAAKLTKPEYVVRALIAMPVDSKTQAGEGGAQHL